MSRRTRIAGRLLRNEDGAAAVEFAIVSVAFLTFIFAIAYIGIIIYTNATLQWAVERASRLEIGRASCRERVSSPV